MLLKQKKQTVLQLTALLVAAVFAIVLGVGACDSGGASGDTGEDPIDISTYTWGSAFTPLKLGLTPGNDSTEVMLNWASTGNAAGKVAQVRFIRGTKEEAFEVLTANGTVSQQKGTVANTFHKAKVTGLQPGASYQYSVSNDGTHWSPMYNFKVAADTGAWSFAAVADPQLTNGNVDSLSRYPANTTTTRNGWIETVGVILSKGVSFIAGHGDQVDATTANEGEYMNFFAPAGLRNLPFAPVSGNHEPHLSYNDHFNWPNAQIFATDSGLEETVETEAGRNYYYRYNNVLFVGLNTAPYPTVAGNGANAGSVGGDPDNARAKACVDRFEETIKAAKAAHVGKYDWIVVSHHKSTASVATHAADRDIQAYVEQGFETIMSEQNVDFVLAGHDHVYARSYPLAGRKDGKVSVPDKTSGGTDKHTYTSPGNPIYLTFTTGSGLKYYTISDDKTSPGPINIGVANTIYPYLENTDAEGESSTRKGADDYKAGYMPVSNLERVQPFIPSYCIVEVNGRTIKFSTYAIATVSGTDSVWATEAEKEAYNFDASIPYDWVQVTK